MKSRKSEKLSMRNSMIRLTSRITRSKILVTQLISSTNLKSMLFLPKSSSISQDCKTSSTEAQWEEVDLLDSQVSTIIEALWEANNQWVHNNKWEHNHQCLNRCKELECQDSNKWECNLNLCCHPCPWQEWWEFLLNNSKCHPNSNMLRRVSSSCQL